MKQWSILPGERYYAICFYSKSTTRVTLPYTWIIKPSGPIAPLEFMREYPYFEVDESLPGIFYQIAYDMASVFIDADIFKYDDVFNASSYLKWEIGNTVDDWQPTIKHTINYLKQRNLVYDTMNQDTNWKVSVL